MSAQPNRKSGDGPPKPKLASAADEVALKDRQRQLMEMLMREEDHRKMLDVLAK